MNKRKFQLSNGYLLEFDQLARVMNAMVELSAQKKISKQTLCEVTGLMNRHVETLVSMGSAMGLIVPGNQILSPIGKLVAANDVFIESKGTLEWCHYIGAGSPRNLVWFEVFNTLLSIGRPMTIEECMERLRKQFAGEYTENALGKNLREEVRFIVDAYLNRHFKKLEILHRSGDQIYVRRMAEITPLVFAATVYECGAKANSRLIQTNDLLAKPGSLGVVFAMDEATLRGHLEKLHEKGWLRYETTHNLDQMRLREGFTSIAFLESHFEGKEPTPNQTPKNAKQESRDLFA